MVTLTQTLAKAAALLEQATLTDQLQVLDVGQPVTLGATVSRPLSASGQPVAGLVQTTTLANAVEGLSESVYAVKVARTTPLAGGQAVRVLACAADPSLVGAVLLVEKVSQNGRALIRKGIASKATTVNSQGKEGLV